jgi:hypothetical protein
MKRSLVAAVMVVVLGGPAHAQEDDGTPASSDAPQAAPAPQRLSRLQGTAYLDRNDDVIGATVVVYKMEDRSKIYLTSTDEHGRFKIDSLPDGRYKVRVHRHGVETIVKNDVNVRFPFRAVVELDMEQVEEGPILPTGSAEEGETPTGMATLKGIARTPGGNPMAEVKLRLVKIDGRTDPLMATTAEDGTFQIDGIPAGEWRVTIVGVGMLPIRTWIYLAGDDELDIRLVLQPAAYEPSPLELMPVEEPIPPPGMGQAIQRG